MTVYPLHPLCSLFPRMTGPEYDAFVNDLRANGLREPITLHEGMILDGGNRIRACFDAGIEPRFVQFSGENLAAFVLSANLHRRHLSPGQQAAIVASAQDWSSAQVQGGVRRPNDNQKCKIALMPQPASSSDRAAKSGASVRTQKMADKVAKANPELAIQVAHGEISLPDAMQQITGKRPGAKQKVVAKSDGPEYDPAEEELENAHQTVRELAEENEALKDRLAVEVMPGDRDDKAAALATIQELRNRVKVLEVELDAVKASRDQYMREAGAMKQQLKMQRKEIDKLKGVSDGRH